MLESHESYKCRKFKVVYREQEIGPEVGHGFIIIDLKEIGRPIGLIEDIWTHELHRKKGIGSQIVKELLEIAKKFNCYKVVLQCQDYNIKFYKQLGFEVNQHAMRINYY